MLYSLSYSRTLVLSYSRTLVLVLTVPPSLSTWRGAHCRSHQGICFICTLMTAVGVTESLHKAQEFSWARANPIPFLRWFFAKKELAILGIPFCLNQFAVSITPTTRQLRTPSLPFAVGVAVAIALRSRHLAICLHHLPSSVATRSGSFMSTGGMAQPAERAACAAHAVLQSAQSLVPSDATA